MSIERYTQHLCLMLATADLNTCLKKASSPTALSLQTPHLFKEKIKTGSAQVLKQKRPEGR